MHAGLMTRVGVIGDVSSRCPLPASGAPSVLCFGGAWHTNTLSTTRHAEQGACGPAVLSAAEADGPEIKHHARYNCSLRQ
jgi:hypothetical protein